ncbi:MAG TPA: thymidine phosphorylase family protein [Albitalea sp.]|nr:thymidine phosphorylase family protein [Albitalea sp.]
MPASPNLLRLRRLGIDTYQEPVLYMHRDCSVCRAEGFEAQSRVELCLNGRTVIATVNVVVSDLVAPGEAGLSEAAWHLLQAQPGELVDVRHSPPLESLSHLRAKVYGHRLGARAFSAVIGDIAAGRYSDLHLASFVTACAGDHLDLDETIALTRAMVNVGDRMHWGNGRRVMDKHCVGGLPGNRTTLIVVPIVAACGLLMPKTSSRAITSPAGTADAMETVAPVDLDVPAIRRVVERTGGCIVWGGAVRLSPADDLLIRVERPLDIDSESQLVASVLSKKVAAGSTHVVIDVPVGPTAKVRSASAAATLGERLHGVGRALGLELRLVTSDGRQPVGRGIGPALEARDALSVLRGEAAAPADLRERALRLAAEVLELSGLAAPGLGLARAQGALDVGAAWHKFVDICEAQGGLREPPRAMFREPVEARHAGRIRAVDNRQLARIAKLAGAPKTAAAGLELHVRLGDRVEPGQPLFTLHGQAPGELAYARRYVDAHADIFEVAPEG